MGMKFIILVLLSLMISMTIALDGSVSLREKNNQDGGYIDKKYVLTLLFQSSVM